MASAARLPVESLGYHSVPLPQLQEALARYLATYRSLSVDPEQIIITSSTRQSLLLAATLYADPGDLAWVESPGYQGAVDAFRTQGLTLAAKSVDRSGCMLEFEPSEKSPAIIYLTPCFQYPTGAPLDAQRRMQLLSFARIHRSVIFEDDYDSEFRDDSQARPALAAQQTGESPIVLHAGTFSKLIFPAARIAWLVVPKAHVERANQCLRTLGGAHNSVAQATIAEIINNGSLAKHLQRARGVYSQRCEALLKALDATGLFLPITDACGSLSLVARLSNPMCRKALRVQLAEQRIGAQFLEELVWESAPTDKVSALVLGLGNVSTLKVPETVGRLERALLSCESC